LITLKFIIDSTGLDTFQVSVMIFNLALLYFLWDVVKFIISVVGAKLGKGRKRW